jgi:hypothetical protein
MSWGGMREGAGRPRGDDFVRLQVASGGGTRTTIYRGLRRSRRLTPEAMDFATADRARGRMITGKALCRAADTGADDSTVLQAPYRPLLHGSAPRGELDCEAPLVTWQPIWVRS